MKRIVAMEWDIYFGNGNRCERRGDISEYAPRVRAQRKEYLWEVKVCPVINATGSHPVVMMQALFDRTFYDYKFESLESVASGSFDEMWPIFEAHVRMLL